MVGLVYKISGNHRKQVKSDLARLKSLIKYFWHNEFTLEMYGMGALKEEAQKILDKLKADASKLEALLAEEVIES